MTAHAEHRMSGVVNPTVPAKVKFAGADVSLDRVDMFERLDRELTAISYTHGNTLLTIKRANRYFPSIVPILKENGVPEDLVYLACIESSMNPTALSPAKAAGLWQFMPATAREYGLEVNEYVDERMDVEKATRAACRYLKTAYNKFGNWKSAAASYNGGMGRISSELSSQMAESAYDLYLTEETSRYMFRLLAMKMIMEHPRRYGFELTDDQLYQPYRGEYVEVSESIDSWPQWAAEHGTNYMTLRNANPWIRAKSLPNKSGKTYRVLIPSDNMLSRSKNKNHTYNSNWTRK
ncbi:MAG: lytic transglycosylase domain-containing protein [Bacteroides sp.]|nr:lytic transglycosylase domain-containing protein [Bacteroides sp.]MCM1413359.1 lytic transglycosylase domain-containing protein [Bacteroides sp.]MCM1471955.1 lytic transglycosylase domain-containing protein [Bacteroides sp.]